MKEKFNNLVLKIKENKGLFIYKLVVGLFVIVVLILGFVSNVDTSNFTSVLSWLLSGFLWFWLIGVLLPKIFYKVKAVLNERKEKK